MRGKWLQLQSWQGDHAGVVSYTGIMSLMLTGLVGTLPQQIEPLLSPPAPPVIVAQANAAIAPQRRLQVNGRDVNGYWLQLDNQLYLSDLTLQDALGVTLLSTGQVGTQPVQWFSDNTPMALPARVINGQRYLAIAPLVQWGNWRTQVQAGQLRIQTPAAQVLNIRQGRQPWGDRFVIDLDQATSWHVTEQAGRVTVTLAATVTPAQVQALQSRPGAVVRTVQVQPQTGGSQIQITVPETIKARVWTLANPNRLVIDLRADPLMERDIAWAEGMRWQQRYLTVGNARFPLTVLTIDPRHPQIQIRPIRTTAASAPGITPLVTMAQNAQVAAAINAGFFNRNNQLPLGAIRQDGRWLSGPILGRGAIAWNDAGAFTVGRVALQETVTTSTGQSFPITTLNSGYVQAGIARYTAEWGSTYAAIAGSETVAIVRQDRVVQQQALTAVGQTVAIPSDGYLLVMRSFNTAANALPVGTPVAIASQVTPSAFNDYPHIMGAGPLLIANQQIVLNAAQEGFSPAFIQQAAVRSAIGILPNRQIVLVAVHNRVGGNGPTLNEMARIMQQIGVTDALNLDGGSSTSLYLGGNLIDRPSSTAGRVNNGIGVFIQP